MYEKVAIITQLLHRAKGDLTVISNMWYLIIVPTITTFFSEISQQILNIYKWMVIITHMWLGAKFYFTCISSRPWYLIMVPNMKNIHKVIMEECPRTARRTDRGTDRLISLIPIFPDSTVVEWGIISHTMRCWYIDLLPNNYSCKLKRRHQDLHISFQGMWEYDDFPMYLTTEVMMTPNTFPVEPCDGEDCYGYLV